MKEKKPFEIPESILSQLNEVTLSYCLCYIDENGSPSIITRADNHAFYLAMQSQLASWIEANKEMAKDCNIAEMMEGCEIKDDEDE